jgi:hypothetical protein
VCGVCQVRISCCDGRTMRAVPQRSLDPLIRSFWMTSMSMSIGTPRRLGSAVSM